MHIAIIGGASTIGSTTAYAALTRDPSTQITLVDIDEEAARGHARGLRHARYHLAEAPIEDDRETAGPITGIHPDAIDTIDPDVAILAASNDPPPEEPLTREFRDQGIEHRLEFLDALAAQLESIGPLPVVSVTNPIDRVVYYLWQQLGWARERFIGYSLSETARLADAIAEVRDADPTRVYCPTMGEHGAHFVPVFSRATIDGTPLDLDDAERADVREFTLDIPVRIANQRGVRESSRWVTSAGIRRVLSGLAGERKSSPLCLSVPLDGEYGLSNVALAVPVRLNRDGVAEIFEWDLAPEERRSLKEAADAIRETLVDVT